MSFGYPENRPPEPATNQEWLVPTYTARDWAYGIFRDKEQYITDYSADSQILRGVDWTSPDGLVRYELESVDDYSETGCDISSKYRLMVCHAGEKPWEYYQICAGENDAYQCNSDWEIILGQDIKASTKKTLRHLQTNPIDDKTMQTFSDIDEKYWKLLEANGMLTKRYKFARWCGRLLSD